MCQSYNRVETGNRSQTSQSRTLFGYSYGPPVGTENRKAPRTLFGYSYRPPVDQEEPENRRAKSRQPVGQQHLRKANLKIRKQ